MSSLLLQPNRWSAEEGQNGWRLRYDPTPGGKKNEDGSTTYSMSFPALELTEYVSEPEHIAKAVACELNAFDAMLDALRRIEALGSDGEHSGDRHASCRDIARSAIAKAEGRS